MTGTGGGCLLRDLQFSPVSFVALPFAVSFQSDPTLSSSHLLSANEVEPNPLRFTSWPVFASVPRSRTIHSPHRSSPTITSRRTTHVRFCLITLILSCPSSHLQIRLSRGMEEQAQSLLATLKRSSVKGPKRKPPDSVVYLPFFYLPKNYTLVKKHTLMYEMYASENIIHRRKNIHERNEYSDHCFSCDFDFRIWPSCDLQPTLSHSKHVSAYHITPLY